MTRTLPRGGALPRGAPGRFVVRRSPAEGCFRCELAQMPLGLQTRTPDPLLTMRVIRTLPRGATTPGCLEGPPGLQNPRADVVTTGRWAVRQPPSWSHRRGWGLLLFELLTSGLFTTGTLGAMFLVAGLQRSSELLGSQLRSSLRLRAACDGNRSALMDNGPVLRGEFGGHLQTTLDRAQIRVCSQRTELALRQRQFKRADGSIRDMGKR
jgi:hypothetical protein